MISKPKLRIDAQVELRAAIANWIETTFRGEFPFQNCLNCLNFNEKSEICKLYNAKPPARVIVYGCEKFDDISEIPF